MAMRKFVIKDTAGHMWKQDANYNPDALREVIEYPFFSATIARDGSVIVSKSFENGEKSADFSIEPELLYQTIETLLARVELILPVRAIGNILIIGEM